MIVYHKNFSKPRYLWILARSDILTSSKRHFKARSDGARKTHQPGLFIYACEKRTQIEKILSTAFYAANYAGLNEPLASQRIY